MQQQIGPYQLDEIYQGDALKSIEALPAESIDLVVTSPPWNLGDRYAGKKQGDFSGKWSRVIQYDGYDDDLHPEQYLDWQQAILRALWRVIKPTGAIFYNHKPRILSGTVDHRMQLIPAEVNLRQVVIWSRPKGHNFNDGYFVPSYEWIFIIAKPEYRIKRGFAGMGDVWEFAPAQANDHPAPFPIDLPRRAIAASEGCEVVLDCFCGSGTTPAAARMEGKHYIGFELSDTWVRRSRTRLLTIQAPLFIAEQVEPIKIAEQLSFL